MAPDDDSRVRTTSVNRPGTSGSVAPPAVASLITRRCFTSDRACSPSFSWSAGTTTSLWPTKLPVLAVDSRTRSRCAITSPVISSTSCTIATRS